MTKFILSPKSLSKVLSILYRVVPVKTAINSLTGFLFTPVDGSLKITASNDIFSCVNTLSPDSIEGTETFVVPAKMLLDMLKTLPEAPTRFEYDEGNFKITWANGSSSLPTLPAADYPAIPECTGEGIKEIDIPCQGIAEALHKTIFAIGDIDLHPNLNGALFDLSGEKINIVTTDTRRLIVYESKGAGAQKDGNFVLPTKSAAFLQSMLTGCEEDETATVAIAPGKVKFTTGAFTFISSVCEGKFPDYRKVIPAGAAHSLNVDRELFAQALRRIGSCAETSAATFQLDLQPGKKPVASLQDLSMKRAIKETLTGVNYNGTGLSICFNLQNLSSVIENYSADELLIRTRDHKTAAVIEAVAGLEGDAEPLTSIVMPSLAINSTSAKS